MARAKKCVRIDLFAFINTPQEHQRYCEPRNVSTKSRLQTNIFVI